MMVLVQTHHLELPLGAADRSHQLVVTGDHVAATRASFEDLRFNSTPSRTVVPKSLDAAVNLAED